MQLKSCVHDVVSFTCAVLLIGALLLMGPQPAAAAGDGDGNSLLERCRDIDKIDKRTQGVVLNRNETNNLMYCMGHFNGMLGMYYETVRQDNFKTAPYCLPEGANWKPIARIVVAYLEKHPELLEQPAETLATSALAEALPCKKEQ